MYFTFIFGLTCVPSTCNDQENPPCISFKATLRNFPQHAMEFEAPLGSDYRNYPLLNSTLMDERPTFIPSHLRASLYYGNTKLSKNAAVVNYGKFLFDQYFMDVPRLNIPQVININLTKRNNGLYMYDSNENKPVGFFPLDKFGYSEEYMGQFGHKFWFTTHINYPFYYRGNETFSFSGDDDLFIFLNKTLVCDLGGIHPRLECTINLNTLNLMKNTKYSFDVYHAERHSSGSNFKVTTSILPRNVAPVSEDIQVTVSGPSNNIIKLPLFDANDDDMTVTIKPPYPQFGKILIENKTIDVSYNGSLPAVSRNTLNYIANDIAFGLQGFDTIFYTIKDHCVESQLYSVDVTVVGTVRTIVKYAPIVRDPIQIILDRGELISINITAWDMLNYTLYYLDDSLYRDLWIECINVVNLNQTTGILTVQGISGSCNYTYLVSNKVFDPPSRGRIEFLIRPPIPDPPATQIIEVYQTESVVINVDDNHTTRYFI
eukprot:NODE_51_length_31136_cov_0.357670.p4 type:complete len:488 gc:universal NODE_51_length_31136_cov_0.357670:22059-23522(+)